MKNKLKFKILISLNCVKHAFSLKLFLCVLRIILKVKNTQNQENVEIKKILADFLKSL